MKTYSAYMSNPAGGERVVRVIDTNDAGKVVYVWWVDEMGTRRDMHEYRHNLRPIVKDDGKQSFRFATDSEYGYLCAESFEDACNRLEKMVPVDAREDGGWGWVETAEPRWQRYQVGVMP